MISRTSSTPVCEAASISITSMCRPSAIARHGSHSPQGSMVGPPCPSGPRQFSAFATSRAVEVLPTPRTPVSRKAWAIRPRSMALASVLTIASWPINSWKLCGRYLRASTRYGVAALVFSGCGGSSRPRPGDSASSISRGLGGEAGHCERWEPERPEAKSLWLLPSGPDQVGDCSVRPTPGAHMVDAGRFLKPRSAPHPVAGGGGHPHAQRFMVIGQQDLACQTRRPADVRGDVEQILLFLAGRWQALEIGRVDD